MNNLQISSSSLFLFNDIFIFEIANEQILNIMVYICEKILLYSQKLLEIFRRKFNLNFVRFNQIFVRNKLGCESIFKN